MSSPHSDQDSSSSSDSAEDETAIFHPVITSIQLQELPKYACKVRQKSITTPNQPTEHTAIASARTKVDPPIFGSYHILYPIIFSDNTRWLLKIPAIGTRREFTSSASRALRSEALTMRLLRHETTIPVPEVFDFSDTCDNELNCPFILMGFIAGRPLSEVWFSKYLPAGKKEVEARRRRCLWQISDAMVQLGKFSFEHGGAMMFDERGRPRGIGKMRVVDSEAMLWRRRGDNDNDESTIYVDVGPFTNTRDYYTALLDRRRDLNSLFKGMKEILRIWVDWIPESGSLPESNGNSQGRRRNPEAQRKPFVLAHPDFDIQNFIVSEEGDLNGIIDWDGVSAVPQSVGNERYPGWLTRDWDPMLYAWNEGMEKREGETRGLWEDSPATLAYYRSVYAGFMEARVREVRGRNDDRGGVWPGSQTRVSLVAEKLSVAASEPLCTEGIVDKVLGAIAETVRQEPSPLLDSAQVNGDPDPMRDFSVYEVSCGLAEGRLRVSHHKLLTAGFDQVLQNI